MGKAREQEVRLMGLGFTALAVLATLLLVAGAVRIGAAVRHDSPGTTPATQLELLGSQQR